MENIKQDKTITSLKVWKQSQQKLKLLAVLEQKTMQQVLDELITKALEERQRGHESV
ncbi:MAG TPA: hypothetical protein VL461_11510 [Dictyobacter sp.]|nr:hypothetical protein [Dictyobacter sp.]